jgi:mannose-1-phosphate guanylyltransferase / mannose-6-phosphate isomerase
MRRDSGPAIAAGATFAETRDPNAVVLALAADHVVTDTFAFTVACRQYLIAANASHIATFGVHPKRSATEYGYIKPGDRLPVRFAPLSILLTSPVQQGGRLCE